MKSFCHAVVLAVVVGVLTACSQPALQFQSTDITGAPFSARFRLTDQTGKARSLEDFKGKVVALFFGYTHCPDVCPTTMMELKGAMATLGPEAARDVQVLFVTVDPDRDTQAVLAQYVPAFDTRFLGLRGSEAELQALAKQMRIVYQRSEGMNGSYTMDHTAGTYIFDQAGRIRLMVAYGAGSKVFAHDLKLLLAQD